MNQNLNENGLLMENMIRDQIFSIHKDKSQEDLLIILVDKEIELINAQKKIENLKLKYFQLEQHLIDQNSNHTIAFNNFVKQKQQMEQNELKKQKEMQKEIDNQKTNNSKKKESKRSKDSKNENDENIQLNSKERAYDLKLPNESFVKEELSIREESKGTLADFGELYLFPKQLNEKIRAGNTQKHNSNNQSNLNASINEGEIINALLEIKSIIVNFIDTCLPKNFIEEDVLEINKLNFNIPRGKYLWYIIQEIRKNLHKLNYINIFHMQLFSEFAEKSVELVQKSIVERIDNKLNSLDRKYCNQKRAYAYNPK